jgi:hypothetical protein
MKSLLGGLLLALISIHSFAQKAPIKFGNATMEDLQMTVYPSDSAASAVVLCDYGVSQITYSQNQGFRLEFDRITRVKILKKEGLEYANFEIPLYHTNTGKEKASSIKGITYNLQNGKITETKLGSSNIFEEETTSNWDRVKIAFPNVKEGSVIDLTYTVTSDFFFNFQDWEFQSTIPVKWSEYRAYIPEYFHYRQYLQGYVPVTVNDLKKVPNSIMLTYTERTDNGYVTKSNSQTEKIDFEESRYQWAIANVPAFKDEPFMTSRKDFISKMNFELELIKMPNQPIKPMMGSWDQINKEFYDSYSQEIKGNNFLKNNVEEITKGLATPEEKIAAVCNYVKRNVQYEGSYSSKYTTKSLKKVLEEKKGNATEINLLVASMLEKAEIPVSAVLLSTRDHGLIREGTPASTQFNYVIAAALIGDKIFLLDATEKLLPSNLIPERCLNGKGLLVNESAVRWINLETKLKSKSTTTAELTLQNESQLVGKLRRDFAGYAALSKRKGFFNKGEEDYLKDFIASHLWERQKSEFKNTEDLGNPFSETHELLINENVTAAGDVVYIEPFVIDRLKTNPFVSEQRQYPVDFGSPSEQTFMYKLTVPENYKIEEIPTSKILALPENAAKYLYNVSVNGNVVSITSILSINKAMYVQDEYPNLREFYNQVVAKQSEQIVLKKN